MTLSWRQRRVVHTHRIETIADGVAGRFPLPEVLEDLLEVVDDAVLVDDDAITSAMRLLLDGAGLVAEPSAALGVAAVLSEPDRFAGRTIATVVCGSNVAADRFRGWTSPPAPGR